MSVSADSDESDQVMEMEMDDLSNDSKEDFQRDDPANRTERMDTDPLRAEIEDRMNQNIAAKTPNPKNNKIVAVLDSDTDEDAPVEHERLDTDSDSDNDSDLSREQPEMIEVQEHTPQEPEITEAEKYRLFQQKMNCGILNIGGENQIEYMG